MIMCRSACNDASNLYVAQSNCSYCAVGGLFGKPASVIMGDVFRMMGEAIPSGEKTGDDGSDGFARLYAKNVANSAMPEKGKDTLRYQIQGIKYYLMKKGCRATNRGDTNDLLTISEAQRYVNTLPEGTLFLVLAGEEDLPGQGISSLAHWTCGQVQGGKGLYYDYQLKMSRNDIKDSLEKKAKNKGIHVPYGETRVGDKPMGPMGADLDDSDGRVVVLVVSK